jgi:hypothetical protein
MATLILDWTLVLAEEPQAGDLLPSDTLAGVGEVIERQKVALANTLAQRGYRVADLPAAAEGNLTELLLYRVLGYLYARSVRTKDDRFDLLAARYEERLRSGLTGLALVVQNCAPGEPAGDLAADIKFSRSPRSVRHAGGSE